MITKRKPCFTLILLLNMMLFVFSEPLQFVGCFKDSDPRDLPQRVHEHGGSVRDCIKTCKDMKFRFAGIQYAYLCFCGNLHGRFGQLPNGRCDSDCKHVNDTQCGGEWANSVYKTGRFLKHFLLWTGDYVISGVMKSPFLKDLEDNSNIHCSYVM